MLREPILRVRPWFLGLLAAGLAVRIAFVLSLADVFVYGEELEKGTAAKAMLDRLGVEHHRLAYHYYEGGGFVVSHLKALAFLLVGQNLLAHKLVALAFFAAIFVTGFKLCRRHFGGTTAVSFGALFALGPEAFQKLSLISLGIHFEASLFALLAFSATMTLIWRDRAGWRAIFLLGLAGGFGCYFSYQLVPVVAWCGLWLVLRRPHFVLGPLGLVGLAGFALGLVPLGLMWREVGEQVFFVHGTWLLDQQGPAGVPNSFLLRDFVRSLYLDKTPLQLVGVVAWPLAFVASTLQAVFAVDRDEREHRGEELFLALFVPYWLTIYFLSSFVQGEVYHYFLFNRFAILWAVSAIVIARGLARQLRSEEATTVTLGAACSVALAAVGLLGAWHVLRTGRPFALEHNASALVRTKGYSYAPYFAKFIPHLEGTAREKLTVLARFREERRDLLYPAITSELYKDSDRTFEELYATFEEFDAEGASDLVKGLGPLVLRRTNADLASALKAVEGAPERYREALREAVGRFGADYRLTAADLDVEVAAGLGRAGAVDYWFGLGDRVRRHFWRRPDLALEFIARQPEEARGPLETGWRAAIDRQRL